MPPRPQRRGRIEAAAATSSRRRKTRPPRPQRRGRIEAHVQLPKSPYGTFRLHGLNAVAELKPADGLMDVKYSLSLHGLNAVAELKPVVVDGPPGVPGASTASTPWPN